MFGCALRPKGTKSGQNLRQLRRIDPFLSSNVESDPNGVAVGLFSLFALQAGAVLLLPQLPPVQVAGALPAVHAGTQEDEDAARYQPGDHPALQVKETAQGEYLCKEFTNIVL